MDAKVVERKQSFENEKSALNDEIARLRESIKTSSALISNFEELKHKLGDEDPAAVLLKLKTYEEEIKSCAMTLPHAQHRRCGKLLIA